MNKLSSFYNRDIIQKAFWRTLIIMTLAELTSSLAVMIDGIILARFLGGSAIAAHGLTIPYTNLIKMLGGFFAAGTQVVCSRKIGKNDLKGANGTFTASFVFLMGLTVMIGLGVTVFAGPISIAFGAGQDMEALYVPTASYLRGLGIGLPFTVGTMMLIPIVALNGDKKRIAFSTNALMCVNIAGDLLNVFVLHGDMLGMALATTFSYLVSFIILLFHFRKKTGICFVKLQNFKEIGDVARAGLLPSFARACSFIKSYVINIIYLTYAGTAALAANSLIQNNVKVVFICIATAIGQTTLIMTGILYGEEDRRGLNLMYKAVLRISFGACLVLTAVIFVLSPLIISIFGAEELTGLATDALRIFIIGFPFISLKMFYIFYFQGSHNSKMSYLSSVLGELVFITITSFVFLQWFGTTGLWVAYPVSELLYLVTIFVICWVRNGHIPRKPDDLLFLPEKFDVSDEDKMDFSVGFPEEVAEMSEVSRQFCLSHGVSVRNSFYVALAVEEMVYNIFDHGFNDGKKHFVDLKIIRKEDSIKIRVRDDCRMFNPKERSQMLPEDDPSKGIGLKMVFGIAHRVSTVSLDYVNILNLNYIVIEIKD